MKLSTDQNGHRTLNGGRWHYPMTGDPSRCGEPGCDHEMGTL